ncbi:MAG: hypothetical protein AB1439_01865 [candidate division FCPU426 bacterium]
MKRGLIRFFAAVLFIALALPVGTRADDRQALEDSLFDNPDAMVQAQPEPDSSAMPMPEEKTGVGFSGEITSVIADALGRTQAADTLYTYTVGDVFLDARLAQGAKVFADLEAMYYAQTQLTQVSLQEFFCDFNFDRAVYFRAGKQVLQWGRCTLWNPTDLVNIDRPVFIRRIGTREGAYGLKFHVPYGTVFNLYGFVDTAAAVSAEKTAVALKAEYLLGNFEMAFSGWAKKGSVPVWGADFSTRVFGLDLVGEASVSRGDLKPRLEVNGGELLLREDPEAWRPRVSANLSRGFRVGDFDDRLLVAVEAYYNGAGLPADVLSDQTAYPLAAPWVASDESGQLLPVTSATRKMALEYYRLREPNNLSPWYTAVFVTFSRFLLTDMTATGNYLRNLLDQSSVASVGLTYSRLNGFSIGALVNAYFGEPEREYTVDGGKLEGQLTFSLVF